MNLQGVKPTYVFTIFSVLFFSIILSPARGQITGLDGFKIFLDPGHAQTENMGLYNYSEAEKVLRVAWELRDMFENQTDISEVHLCRLTDDDQISLEGRTTLANELGVDFYYSIHSDAGSPSANTTLMLYGGWRKDGQTIEKTPSGGAAFGDILDADLTGAMRIGRRGNWPDRNFYLGVVDTHQNQWPYLYVNRTTEMPSLLSEAGFHTNPTQQQRNLNADWKKLEALSAFRSFLEYMNIDRPDIGIVTGIITDEDTGIPANGVTVTIGDNVYTTDTYESLFNKYSNDPDLLHNGFYWIEGLTPGEEVEIVFSSDAYETRTVNQTIASKPNGRTHENLTFVDIALTSTIPPVVDAVNTGGDMTSLVPGTDVKVVFSRKMDKASVENAISVAPVVDLQFSWEDEFTLLVGTANMDFVTEYNFSIEGAVAKNSATGQCLDGDADGTEGGDFQFSITTSPEDVTPPKLVSRSPSVDNQALETRPVIRLVYDEVITSESVNNESIVVAAASGGEPVAGSIRHDVVKDQSVLHFFPEVDLENNATYNISIAAGLQDAYGNATENQSCTFDVNAETLSQITVIDNFNSGISGWWQPQQSGSTSGIETEETSRDHEQGILMESLGSSGSMNLSYGWLADANNYIRLYLPPGSSQNENKFGPEHVLQVYVFGDGSGNEFRFMMKDGNSTYEASPWYSIDWKGWKLVSWNLTDDPAYAWVNGDGVIDGDGGFFLDGLHFRRGNEGDLFGNIYFDDLRFVSYGDETNIWSELQKNTDVLMYPNPVKDVLNIEAQWEIREIGVYNLQGQLVHKETPGNNSVIVGLEHLNSGYYVIRVQSFNETFEGKIFIQR